jgi:hypothetical protein
MVATRNVVQLVAKKAIVISTDKVQHERDHSQQEYNP